MTTLQVMQPTSLATPPAELKIEEAVSHQARRAVKNLTAHMVRFFQKNELNITYEQWLVLNHLGRQNGQNQQQVGEACFRDKASVTRLLDSLSELRLVYRMPDPHDRRNNLLFLTPDGLELRAKLETIAEQARAEVFEGLENEELNACAAVLQRLADNADKACNA